MFLWTSRHNWVTGLDRLAPDIAQGGLQETHQSETPSSQQGSTHPQWPKEALNKMREPEGVMNPPEDVAETGMN